MKTPTRKQDRWPVAGNLSSSSRRGFTWTELLVTVAIVAILVALLWPMTTDHGRPVAIRTKCLSGLRQYNLGLLTYGYENHDRLPDMAVMGNAGSLPWEIPKTVVDVVLRSGSTRDMLYDPGFPEQNDDKLWNAEDKGGRFRIIGYVATFPGSTIKPEDQNRLTHQFHSISSLGLPPPKPSIRVLSAGVVISAPKTNPTVQLVMANPSQFNFVSVRGLPGFNNGKGHRSPHLDKTRKLPTGDNSAFLDGSARWIKFTNMTNRVTSGSPNFWW